MLDTACGGISFEDARFDGYDGGMMAIEKTLIDHPSFHWVDGMLGVSATETEHGYFIRKSAAKMKLMEGIYPLLDDPCTKGALLHLIRTAWRYPCHTEYCNVYQRWAVWFDSEILATGRTEGEALGMALINSPGPGDLPALIDGVEN